PEPDPELEVVEEIAPHPDPEPEPEIAEEIAPEPEPEPEPEIAEEIAPEPEPEPEPEIAEEIAPEPEPEPEPEVAEEIAPEPEQEPQVAEEAAPEPEPLPELVLAPAPPMPARKPPSSALAPPAPAEALEEAPAIAEVPEPPAEAPIVAEAPEAPDAGPGYRHQGEIGEVSPKQFLANLTALADENLQAERNPALWEVIRAIRKQMRECWMLDSKNPPSARMTVDMKLNFDKSGRVLKAEIKEIGRMVNDEPYKTFVLDARAALMSCSPFTLPDDKYVIWRSFTMRFVPINRL
ncbi:MAG: hypothetical protein AAF495_25920, partial [Pseudomonadota bacterium]